MSFGTILGDLFCCRNNREKYVQQQLDNGQYEEPLTNSAKLVFLLFTILYRIIDLATR